MKCNNCGFEYEGFEVCPNCNCKNETNFENNKAIYKEENTVTKEENDLNVENNEIYEENEVNENTDSKNFTAVPVNDVQPIVINKQFCKFCGSEININNNYCSACGRSTVDDNIYHCPKCGQILEAGQKFCNSCGNKVSISKKGKAPNKSARKVMIIGVIVIVIAAILTAIGAFAIPKIFVSTDTLLVQCEYERAYNKAKNNEKENVLFENIIANKCIDLKDGLKNPDSFVLDKVWLDKSDDQFVLEVKATNSYGGIVSNYYYYSYSQKSGEYIYITAISDFDEETTYSFDDASERLEKSLKNFWKKIIKEIVLDDSKIMDNGIEERINQINSEGRLKNIELINEVSQIYPADDEEA